MRGSVRTLRGRLPLADVRAAAARAGRKLDLDARLDWVEGWDLMGGAPAWVPLESVTLDCVFPRGYQPTFALGSNGLASGNHLLEAIVHGLCEVIERDAEAHWRLQRGQRRVDLDTVTDPHCRALLDRIAAGPGAHHRLGHHLRRRGAGLRLPPSWRTRASRPGGRWGCTRASAATWTRRWRWPGRCPRRCRRGSRTSRAAATTSSPTTTPAPPTSRCCGRSGTSWNCPPAERVDFARAPRLAGADLRGRSASCCSSACGPRAAARCWWWTCPGPSCGSRW